MIYEEAIKEMLRWAKGEKSHWNDFHAAAGQQQNASGETAIAAMAGCAQADAAEVKKWAVVAEALRMAPLDVEWHPAAEDDDRSLLKRCAEIIWKHEARPCDMMALNDHATIEKLAQDLRDALFP